MRLRIELRKITKNEFDDLQFMYRSLGEQPKIIIDGGANIGFVTYQFIKKFEEASIYAYEPNPEVFWKLSQAFKENPSVKCINKGLSKFKSRLKFYQNRNTGTSSFLEPNEFHRRHLAKKIKGIFEVETIGLTDIFSENNIKHVDILKLDIEGFELSFLEGGEELLVSQKIDFLLLEVNLYPTYKDQPLIEELITFLRCCNYILYNFYGSHETGSRQNLLTNLLFVSAEQYGKLQSSSLKKYF